MIWLLLSISCSILIFIVFKYFKQYEVNNLQAILVNYFIAFTIGNWQNDWANSPLEIPEQAWFYSILLLGLLFISLFRLMAWVSQNFGLATVSVAVKMSVIVPVSFGVVYFKESLGPLKLSGIIMALVAVYMTTYKPDKTKKSAHFLWYPILLFLGSGFLDAFLKYNESQLVPPSQQAWFASSIFGMAAIFGIFLVLHQIIRTDTKLEWKSLIGGIALGIPNYGSIYFLLRALSFEGLESSSIFALNNVGIVTFSALLGTFFFKEKLIKINTIGILLAILSIVLITIAL